LGIGAATTAHLNKHGIRTALQFAQQDFDWVKRNFTKPHQEIWRELRGEMVYEVDSAGKAVINRSARQKPLLRLRMIVNMFLASYPKI